MKLGGNEFSEIRVTTNDGELIVSITDENIIEAAGFEVVCVPQKN